jgi:hypothetical protein
MSEYVCALSGNEPDEEEILSPRDSDELGTMPLNWTRVTLERRLLNSRWIEIQQAKGALVEAALSNVPEENHEVVRPMISLQIDAQFAALEANIPQYENFSEVVYIAPPEDDKVLRAEFFAIREKLGLPISEEEEEE